MVKTLTEWKTSNQTGHLRLPTFNGVKLLRELHSARPDFPKLRLKLERYSKKIGLLFPKHATHIKKYMTLYCAIEDPIVLQMLYDLPENLSFQKDNDPHSPNAMSFHMLSKKIILNEPYLNECLKHEKSVYHIGLFLRKLLHEFNHVVQDKFGALSCAQFGQMNILDALNLHFMSETDSTLMEMRFFNELISPYIQPESDLSNDPVFQEYFIQQALLPHSNDMDINTLHSQIENQMIPYFTSFSTEPEAYTPWQKSYIKHFTYLISGEISAYNNISLNKSSLMTAYKLDYYYNRHPQLIQFSESLPLQPFVIHLIDSFKIYEKIRKNNPRLFFQEFLLLYDKKDKLNPSSLLPMSINKSQKGSSYTIQHTRD